MVNNELLHRQPGKSTIHYYIPLYARYKLQACLIQHLLSYSTHFFFILGGYTGPSGSPGRGPTYPLYNGISGKNGNFRFLIEDR